MVPLRAPAIVYCFAMFSSTSRSFVTLSMAAGGGREERGVRVRLSEGRREVIVDGDGVRHQKTHARAAAAPRGTA